MTKGSALRFADIKDPTAYSDSPIYDMDRRTTAFRRLVQQVDELCHDLGGPRQLSWSQRALAEQVVLFREWLAVQWKRYYAGEKVDMDQIIRVTNSMRQTAEKLGLERRLKTVNLEDLVDED